MVFVSNTIFDSIFLASVRTVGQIDDTATHTREDRGFMHNYSAVPYLLHISFIF